MIETKKRDCFGIQSLFFKKGLGFESPIVWCDLRVSG